MIYYVMIFIFFWKISKDTYIYIVEKMNTIQLFLKIILHIYTYIFFFNNLFDYTSSKNLFFFFREVATSLKSNLKKWLKSPFRENDWEIALSKIIQEDSWAIDLMETSLATYLSKGREIDVSNIETCGKTIRWCTIGDLETNKCTWVAKAARALGVEPSISCIKSNSTFECFRDIAENRTDIITIDSNYGYLART